VVAREHPPPTRAGRRVLPEEQGYFLPFFLLFLSFFLSFFFAMVASLPHGQALAAPMPPVNRTLTDMATDR
jgi:hypothetical protein